MADSLAQTKVNISEQISPDGLPIAQPGKPPVTPAPVETAEITPTEPESKVDDDVIDVADFLNITGKNVEQQPEDKTKTEVKPDATTEVKADVKTEVKPKTATAAREYNDIDEPHREAFKHMTNETFNVIKPAYIELKRQHTEVTAELVKRDEKIKQLQEGKPQIPESYYEHENAFVLTPEFATATQNVNAYNTVLDHWQGQVDAIRAGNAESYTEIHIDPRSGQFYQSAPKPVDKNTEKLLGSYVSFAQQKLMESQAEINLMAKSHKQRVSDSVGWVKNFEASAFKNFETNDNLKAMANDTLNKFPATFKANPMASAFAKALVTINHLGRLLQAKAGTQPAVTATANGKPNPNLTAAEVAGEGGRSKGKSDDDNVSIDDFKRAKEGW